MAVKGDVGKIMFHNAAGTEADVSDLRAWSLTVSKDTLETTAMGATSKSFVGGLISGEGSATLLYNPSGNSDYQQNLLVALQFLLYLVTNHLTLQVMKALYNVR